MTIRIHGRKPNGQGIIVLGIIVSFLIILSLGLYSYELNRLTLARTQLRSAADSAALTAAATLASQDMQDPITAHNMAINTAMNMLRANSVVGINLTSAQWTTAAQQDPATNECLAYFEFLDPNNNNSVVPLGDPRGKVVRLTAKFGLAPSFASALPIGTAILNSVSSAGVPDMDLVVCFDVSGSIDDQTPVTFVRRQWDASKNCISYIVPPTRSGSPAGALAQGKIYDIIGPPPSGTRVNGTYPQYLGLSDDSTRWPLLFSETQTSSRGLRGQTDCGAPPGNCPPGKSGIGGSYTFTDMIVNIDGKNQYQGLTSSDGYAFPDIATVLEASRGNLEDALVFNQSKANTGVPGSIQPRLGYKSKYWDLARRNLHPISDAQEAAASFFNIMNTNTDAHFGFVCFSDDAGVNSSSTYSGPKIDDSYPAGSNVTVPVPNIPLNSSPLVTNYNSIVQVLPSTVAIRSTNIGDAVHKAVQQLTAESRVGAKKAIILFTDGQPTAGGPLDSDPWRNARLSAVEARNAGIPIYTIGLAQNDEIIPEEIAILNDTNSDSSTGGMAAIAGHGGKFFLVTDFRQLRSTFENLARQLVQLVH